MLKNNIPQNVRDSLAWIGGTNLISTVESLLEDNVGRNAIRAYTLESYSSDVFDIKGAEHLTTVITWLSTFPKSDNYYFVRTDHLK